MTNDHPAEIRWPAGRWLRPHAIAAPFGIFLATVVLYLVAAEKPLDRVDVRLAASLVDLGVVLYAMVAVSAETGVRAVFWALDQRRQWRAKMRAEVAAAVKAEVAAAVKADVVAAMKAEVRAVVDAGGDLKEWLDHDGGTLEEEHPKK